MRSHMIVASALLALAGAANADVVLDFEGMGHGEVVADQFATQGVLITAVNFHRPFDTAVVFNSRVIGSADPDLESTNIGLGNLDANLLGNMLILQENDTGLDTGIASDPDDEAGRIAGKLIFDLDFNAVSFGFDIVDVDDVVLEMSSVAFYSGGVLVESVSFEDFVDDPGRATTGVVFGDASANRIDPFGVGQSRVESFDRVVLNLGGSMAVDNLRFSEVPTPASAALLILGGLVAFRRHRH